MVLVPHHDAGAGIALIMVKVRAQLAMLPAHAVSHCAHIGFLCVTVPSEILFERAVGDADEGYAVFKAEYLQLPEHAVIHPRIGLAGLEWDGFINDFGEPFESLQGLLKIHQRPCFMAALGCEGDSTAVEDDAIFGKAPTECFAEVQPQRGPIAHFRYRFVAKRFASASGSFGSTYSSSLRGIVSGLRSSAIW